jgi:uncharacterized membrane protein
MSQIVILGFESKEHADAARAIAEQLQDQGELDLRGMAVGWRDDRGDVRLDHTVPLARSGAVQGALSGGVVGLFLLAPLLGAAVGGAAGALGGKLSQLGLDQLVVKDILKALEPGRAALFLLSDYADADHFAEALSPQHPTVIKTTLPEWEEADLLRALSADY